MSGLKREDELKLQELRRRVEASGGPEDGVLSEDEVMLLSLLEDRYAVFLEEGLRKLRATPSSPRGTGGGNGSSGGIGSFFSKMSPRLGSSSSARRASSMGNPSGSAGGGNNNGGGGGGSFAGAAAAADTESNPDSTTSDPSAGGCGNFGGGGGGMMATVSPMFSSSPNATTSPISDSLETAPHLPQGNHWTFLGERLILGAIPYAAAGSDNIGHLNQLQQHCAARNLQIGMVVACLDPEEECLEGFAGPREWEKQLAVSTFLYFPLPADVNAPITVDFADMLSLCAQIREVTSARVAPPEDKSAATSAMKAMFGSVPRMNRQRAAFIHCKAGRARSWVVVMCYLISQCGVSYDAAEAHVRSKRPKVCPSAVQQEYVKAFEAFVTAPSPPQIRERPELEERYLKVLADVLSLPQSFRARLIADLEKLT